MTSIDPVNKVFEVILTPLDVILTVLLAMDRVLLVIDVFVDPRVVLAAVKLTLLPITSLLPAMVTLALNVALELTLRVGPVTNIVTALTATTLFVIVRLAERPTLAPVKLVLEDIVKFAAALTVPPRKEVPTVIVFAPKIPIKFVLPVVLAPSLEELAVITSEPIAEIT